MCSALEATGTSNQFNEAGLKNSLGGPDPLKRLNIPSFPLFFSISLLSCLKYYWYRTRFVSVRDPQIMMEAKVLHWRVFLANDMGKIQGLSNTKLDAHCLCTIGTRLLSEYLHCKWIFRPLNITLATALTILKNEKISHFQCCSMVTSTPAHSLENKQHSRKKVKLCLLGAAGPEKSSSVLVKTVDHLE